MQKMGIGVVPEKFTLRCQRAQLTSPELLDVIGWQIFCQ
jgi:hypothetical protein